MMASIDEEIEKALDLSRTLIQEYVGLCTQVEFGEHSTHYYDLFDFVNFRVETADTCLSLIRKGKVPDSLGLCRGLLENYLLLILMCRGRRYFRLENLESKSRAEFEEYLNNQQAALERHRQNNDSGPLYIQKYPRAKQRVMYVYEGLTTEDEQDDLIIPAYFFQFQEFRPEAMRLDDAKYFEYFPPSPKMRKARKDYRSEAHLLYQAYFSYEALRACLKLNDFLTADADLRLDAHYTFLGRFLHPTHNAARDMHEDRNYYSERTAVGMGQRYTKYSVLLAALYVGYLLAGIVDEVADMLESAPAKYVRNPGSGGLKSITADIRNNFPYFWFVFNRPPLYDKFNFAVNHVTQEELASYGGYEGIPDSAIAFDSDIYRHIEHAVNAWVNDRVGRYVSPLADMNGLPKFSYGFPVRGDWWGASER